VGDGGMEGTREDDKRREKGRTDSIGERSSKHNETMYVYTIYIYIYIYIKERTDSVGERSSRE
jgi:hypothetical protein